MTNVCGLGCGFRDQDAGQSAALPALRREFLRASLVLPSTSTREGKKKKTAAKSTVATTAHTSPSPSAMDNGSLLDRGLLKLRVFCKRSRNRAGAHARPPHALDRFVSSCTKTMAAARKWERKKLLRNPN